MFYIKSCDITYTRLVSTSRQHVNTLTPTLASTFLFVCLLATIAPNEKDKQSQQLILSSPRSWAHLGESDILQVHSETTTWQTKHLLPSKKKGLNCSYFCFRHVMPQSLISPKGFVKFPNIDRLNLTRLKTIIPSHLISHEFLPIWIGRALSGHCKKQIYKT